MSEIVTEEIIDVETGHLNPKTREALGWLAIFGAIVTATGAAAFAGYNYGLKHERSQQGLIISRNCLMDGSPINLQTRVIDGHLLITFNGIAQGADKDLGQVLSEHRPAFDLTCGTTQP